MSHESNRLFRNLRQRYHVENGQVQLHTWLRTIIIPAEEIESVEVMRPPVFRTNWLALKLDFPDFYEHVSIRRKSGMFRDIRFTPEDPQLFVKAVREIL